MGNLGDGRASRALLKGSGGGAPQWGKPALARTGLHAETPASRVPRANLDYPQMSSCHLALSSFILPATSCLSIQEQIPPPPLLLQPPFPTIVQLPSLLTLPSPFHTSLTASLSQSFHYRFNPAKITLSIYKFLQNTRYTTSLE